MQSSLPALSLQQPKDEQKILKCSNVLLKPAVFESNIEAMQAKCWINLQNFEKKCHISQGLRTLLFGVSVQSVN